MNEIYYLTIKKGKANKAIFSYPCEKYSEELLSGRKLYIPSIENPSLELLKEKLSALSTVTEIKTADDVIVFPPIIEAENTPEGYFETFKYYYDNSEFILKDSCHIHNLIVLLPPHSADYSTDYRMVACYSVADYLMGLAKLAANKDKHIYGVVLGEHTSADDLYHILLYLLSNNSNHLICDIIKLDR